MQMPETRGWHQEEVHCQSHLAEWNLRFHSNKSNLHVPNHGNVQGVLERFVKIDPTMNKHVKPAQRKEFLTLQGHNHKANHNYWKKKRPDAVWERVNWWHFSCMSSYSSSLWCQLSSWCQGSCRLARFQFSTCVWWIKCRNNPNLWL